MGNKQPHDPLFGYPDQATHTTMNDGREVSAGEAVELAFNSDHWSGALVDYNNDGQRAAAWNGLTDEQREAAVTQALVDLDEKIIKGAAEVDLGSAPHQDAAKRLGESIIDVTLQELKAAQKPWQQLTEWDQRMVLERITRNARHAVGETMRLLATRGARHVVCELESITVKKGCKASLEIPKGELGEDLLDAVGQAVILVVGAMDASDEIVEPKPDPDQKSLLEGADIGGGDNGLATHSDPED